MTFYIENTDPNLIVEDINLDFKDDTLNFKLQFLINNNKTNIYPTPPPTDNIRKKLIILAVDKSKSIECKWDKVQSMVCIFSKLINRLTKIQSQHKLKFIFKVILFNETCTTLEYTDNIEEIMKNEIPIGKTCLASAFKMINETIKTYYNINSDSQPPTPTNQDIDTTILLISDGNHSTNKNHRDEFKQLSNTIDTIKLTSLTSTVVCNCIGYKTNANIKRLSDLEGIKNKLTICNGIGDGINNGIFLYGDELSYSFDEYILEKLKVIIEKSNIINCLNKFKYVSLNFESLYMTGGGHENSSEILFKESGNCMLIEYPILLNIDNDNGKYDLSIPLSVKQYFVTHFYIYLGVTDTNTSSQKIIFTPFAK